MDLNTKLNQCQTENYLLDNNCIVWDEEKELLGNLKFYVRHTGLIENSPWAENSDPISHYQKQGLSSLQKKIIQHFHQNFFKHGDPVYMKMQTIANRMQTSRQAVQRAIGRLVKRKILLRFYLFTHNEKTKDHERAYILPNNPLKIKLENRINNLDIKRMPHQVKRLPLLEGRGNHLISNLQESLQKFRCIVYYIYSINYYYSQLSIKSSLERKEYTSYIQQSQSDCSLNEPFCFSDERNKKSMKQIPRYKLTAIDPNKKPLLNKTHIAFNELISSVDYNIFNLPDEKRKNILNHVALHTYDFDFEKLFSEKKLNVKQDAAQKRTRSLLSDYLKLFFSDEPLDYDSTDYVLNYWNLIDDPHFSKHKVDHESATYSQILILTNYMLKFKYNNNRTKFLDVLGRIERFGQQNNWLNKNKNKWKLTDILLYRNSNGLKKYFVEDEDEFIRQLHSYRSKEKDASARWKEIFIDSFYRTDRKKGEQYHKHWHSKFDFFLDLLINKIKACKRQLYGMNLTQMRIIDGYETDSVLGEYCDWVICNYDRKPDIFVLCEYHNYMQFVKERMKWEKGMDKFWDQIRT